MKKLFIPFILILFSCGEIKEDPEDNSSKLLAYSYAEDFVKERLKNPKSAEFPGIFEKADHVAHLGNWEYQIYSWVESTNSFNAVIRSKFVCKIKFDKEKDQVSVRDLVIE